MVKWQSHASWTNSGYVSRNAWVPCPDPHLAHSEYRWSFCFTSLKNSSRKAHVFEITLSFRRSNQALLGYWPRVLKNLVLFFPKIASVVATDLKIQNVYIQRKVYGMCEMPYSDAPMLIIVMGIALVVMGTVLIILTTLHFFFHTISNGKSSKESGTTSASISTLSSIFCR